jgi:hypothetical protein
LLGVVVPGKLRQEDAEFKANQSYVIRLSQNKKKPQNQNKKKKEEMCMMI